MSVWYHPLNKTESVSRAFIHLFLFFVCVCVCVLGVGLLVGSSKWLLQHPQVVLIGPVADEAHISFSAKTDNILGSLLAVKFRREGFSISVQVRDAVRCNLTSVSSYVCLWCFLHEQSELLPFFDPTEIVTYILVILVYIHLLDFTELQIV